MTVNAWIAVLVLPSLSFALLYTPALTRLSPSIASPYPKAEIERRLVAGAVDGSLFAAALYFYANSGSDWFVAAGVAYLLFRDAPMGRSVGKFSAGLVVMNLETGLPCSIAKSARRNVLFVLPGVNVVALLLEPVTVVRDPHGCRLGDRWARTQVVRGLGASDLARAVVRSLPKPILHRSPLAKT